MAATVDTEEEIAATVATADTEEGTKATEGTVATVDMEEEAKVMEGMVATADMEEEAKATEGMVATADTEGTKATEEMNMEETRATVPSRSRSLGVERSQENMKTLPITTREETMEVINRVAPMAVTREVKVDPMEATREAKVEGHTAAETSPALLHRSRLLLPQVVTVTGTAQPLHRAVLLPAYLLLLAMDMAMGPLPRVVALLEMGTGAETRSLPR